MMQCRIHQIVLAGKQALCKLGAESWHYQAQASQSDANTDPERLTHGTLEWRGEIDWAPYGCDPVGYNRAEEGAQTDGCKQEP